MSSGKQSVVFRAWAESVAGSMSDPVKRLRFVQSVAPFTNIWGERRGRHRRPLAAAALLAGLVGALLTFLYGDAAARQVPSTPPPPTAAEPAVSPTPVAGDIWLVEHAATADSYSNGLQIDNTFAVSAERRSYLAFSVKGDEPAATRSDPAGIVFHGTESQQLPFEAGHNDALKKIGESLLEYVQRRRSYNFVIDRFGRVHRIVMESDTAEHAGYSAWADERWLYVNLNQSFLGVAFEARTAPSSSEAVMTAAQTRSAAMLTEMLRARYRIPASDCVTHAQVSVNPSNMRIGYHVDWASDFPFREVGLPDNYGIPLPSITLMGFECDPALRRTARGLRSGVDAAEEIVNRQAAAARQRPAKWRQSLRQTYRQRLAAVRHPASAL